jgi:hypothetical protein
MGSANSNSLKQKRGYKPRHLSEKCFTTYLINRKALRKPLRCVTCKMRVAGLKKIGDICNESKILETLLKF